MKKHVTVFVLFLSGSLLALPDAKPYVASVRCFADTVLRYGRDSFGEKRTPLFADGLHIFLCAF